MLNRTLREKLVFPLVLFVYLQHPWFYLVNGQIQWPQPPGESTPPPSPPGVPCAEPPKAVGSPRQEAPTRGHNEGAWTGPT